MTYISVRTSNDGAGLAALSQTKVRELAGLCGISASQLLKNAEAAGEIITVELFMNDHVEISDRLRKIMAFDRDNPVEFAYYEMQQSGNPAEHDLIDAEILENILSEADGEFT